MKRLLGSGSFRSFLPMALKDVDKPRHANSAPSPSSIGCLGGVDPASEAFEPRSQALAIWRCSWKLSPRAKKLAKELSLQFAATSLEFEACRP
jgi:hypothetical protein